ncbi:MAG: pitrilysin family protein, partial [Syntrophobacteraceae bacterium]
MMTKTRSILLFLLLSLLVLPLSECPAMPKVDRIVLENNLTLLVFEDHSIPAVTIHLLVKAGSWRDPGGAEGVANLTARSTLLGTRNLSFSRINDRLDYLGANLNAECGKDSSTIGMQVLKKELDSGFDLLLEVITGASFPEAEVAREKENVLGRIRSQEDQPIQIANKAFEKALFLNSPYARDLEGTVESLAGVGPEALAKFYDSFYRPNNAIMVIGGDITSDEVKSRLVPKLLGWKPAKIPELAYVSAFAQGTVTVMIDKPFSQATVVIGSPAFERSHKDYYALAVMNHILGSGGLNSRLMTEVRIKAGLAYAVESVLLARKHSGSFRILLQTQNSSAGEAIALVARELERMQQEPVSEAELELAKKFLIGNFPLRFSDTQGDYAKFLAQVEFYGLGTDYPEQYPSIINAITARDILRV